MSNPAPQPLAPGVDLDHDDDSYLLFYMAEAASNRELAEAAFTVFVTRHWDTVMGFCHKQRYETFGDSAEAFVNATFVKAFKHASSFKAPSDADPTAIHRKAQNWLFTILQRLFLDARRKLRDEVKARQPINDKEPTDPICQAEPYEDTETVPSETNRQALTARRRTLLAQFMSELSDRDRAILIQTQDFIDPNTGTTEPPPEELEALALQFHFPTDHIRVYRARILARLKMYIITAERSSS